METTYSLQLQFAQVAHVSEPMDVDTPTEVETLSSNQFGEPMEVDGDESPPEATQGSNAQYIIHIYIIF